ncbi:hypothetical protein PAPYR_8382 [Paratrimastix pyriformis]|uniref:Uncharacterized protein n=1 Tax=Paratrimastix pyriformis TaxID=342808 RepID=A0ABQ8UAT4_9EUKA|nr:hypothetical protein PAPYR_8382 [Paratrimastix pyriformis]
MWPPRIRDPIAAPAKVTRFAGETPVLAFTSGLRGSIDSWWEGSPRGHLPLRGALTPRFAALPCPRCPPHSADSVPPHLSRGAMTASVPGRLPCPNPACLPRHPPTSAPHRDFCMFLRNTSSCNRSACRHLIEVLDQPSLTGILWAYVEFLWGLGFPDLLTPRGVRPRKDPKIKFQLCRKPAQQAKTRPLRDHAPQRAPRREICFGQRGQPLMISEPRKIKLLESVVEAGKRWKLVKLLGACDLFAFFSVRTSHRLVEETYFHRPYRSKPAEYLFELAWGVNTRKYGPTDANDSKNTTAPRRLGLLTPVWWVSDRQEMSRLSPGALQTSSDLPLSQMSIFPAARASTQWGAPCLPSSFSRGTRLHNFRPWLGNHFRLPMVTGFVGVSGLPNRPPSRTHEASQAVYHADCDALFTTIRDHPPMNTTPPKPAAPVRLLLRPTDCEIGVISRYSGLFPVPTAIFMHLSPDMASLPHP